MLSAAEIRSGQQGSTNFGADMRPLKAISMVNLKVIDVRSGEILFICSESRMVNGQANVVLEQSALGGANINSERFVQTVSGQASKIALNNAAQYIIDKFNGKITERSYIGNVVSFSDNQFTGSTADMNEQDSVYFHSSIREPSILERQNSCKILQFKQNSSILF